MSMMITNLNQDVLAHIMSFVAKSGIKNLAYAALVCKKFKEIAEDEIVLNAAVFNGVKLDDRYELFQEVNSLLTKSAIAGNPTAEYMLAKIIISSSMDSSSRASLFMGQFTGSRSPNPKVSRRNLDPPEIMRLFWLRCTHHDLVEMFFPVLLYTSSYIKYGDESSAFDNNIDQFHNTAMALDRHENSKDPLRRRADSMMQYMPLGRSIATRNAGEIAAPHIEFHVPDQNVNSPEASMEELVAEFETKRSSMIATYAEYLIKLI